MMRGMKSKIHILAMMVVGFALSGCATRYAYQGTLDQAIDGVGRGGLDAHPILPHSPAGVGATILDGVKNEGGTVTVVEGAKGEGFTTISGGVLSYNPNALSMYPYVLFTGRKINEGYEWDVKHDSSGIYWDDGKLRIRKEGDSLFVDAPNRVVEDYVVKALKLKK